MLTCLGQTFAARVGASLLTAVGLPELITPDADQYEQRALHLARHPEELRRLGDKRLADQRTWPLFDVPPLVRNLERAYQRMWESHAAGEPPRAIVVSEGEE